MSNREDWAAVEYHVRALAQAVGEAVSSRGEEMAAARGQLKERAGERWHEARDLASRRAREADALARDHVWTTAAVAAAVGTLLGVLLRRRR